MTFKSVNPFDNQELKQFASLGQAEIAIAIEQAHLAYKDWRQTTFEQRKAALKEVSSQLRQRRTKFAELITLEMGKRIEEAKYEINFCAEIVDFYADGAEKFLADQPMTVDNARAYLQHAPVGVLLGVMPWNFPFYQVIRFAAPNIMAGNTVLIKHAQNVPQCAETIEKLFLDCGLPVGVLTNLFAPVELVGDIIADDRVRGVSLTGSGVAGAAVASQAGEKLKKSVLELGGNDAFIILEDANINRVVKMALRGRMVNAGQSCVAAKRFIVVEPVAEQFMEGFAKRVSELRVGDPGDPATEIGPLCTEAAAANLDNLVSQSLAAGAKVLVGGGRPDHPGAFYNPTILTDVTKEMPTYDQELFGPVATVYVVKDEAAAIELANDSSYGLGGSVHTADVERGRKVAEQIDSGMVFVNQSTKSQVDLPFGGTKDSGYGKELSHFGILEFVNRKLIHIKE